MEPRRPQFRARHVSSQQRSFASHAPPKDPFVQAATFRPLSKHRRHRRHIKDLEVFVEKLSGRFGLIRFTDPCWHNRLLIELQEETKEEIDYEFGRVQFPQLVLALCLLIFGPGYVIAQLEDERVRPVAGLPDCDIIATALRCLSAEDRVNHEKRIEDHRRQLQRNFLYLCLSLLLLQHVMGFHV